MTETAYLHWCDAQDTRQVLDLDAITDGKLVRLRADWLDGYQQPNGFRISEELFFLTKLWRRLGGHWHPAAPLATDPATDRITFSRDGWRARPSRVSRQSSYFFTDNQGNTSGSLTVSGATTWVKHTGFAFNGVKVAVSGIGLEMSIGGHIGSETITHGVHAAVDPVLNVEVLTAGGDGELDLVEHVRQLLVERTDPDEEGRYAGGRLELAESLTRDALIAVADGFLSDAPGGWVPEVSPESQVLEVDADRPGEIAVDIPSYVFKEAGRTAYALRITNTENLDDYVISDLVTIESDGETVRIRG